MAVEPSSPCLSRRAFLKSGLAAAGAAAFGSAWAQSGPAAAAATESRPNIVVFLADTLRADHLSLLGYPRTTSPHIDAFAKESIVFERCYAQCSWTKPSVASLLTGMLPRTHMAGVSASEVSEIRTRPVQVLRERFVTLSTCLRDAGYHTAMFQSNPHIRLEFGFAQGIEEFRFDPVWSPKDQVSAAILWMVTKAEAPFFLFLHEIDPHSPYRPARDDYRRMLNSTPEVDLAKLPKSDKDVFVELGLIGQKKPNFAPHAYFERLKDLTDPGRELLTSMYDAEIVRVDRLFNFLLTALKAQGLEDNTIVALIGDHGEAFGEHGQYHHSFSLYDEEMHVPLVLRLPKGIRRHQRIPWNVSLFDLYPTLVELAGATPPEDLQAKALLDRRGHTLVRYHRSVFATLDNWQRETERWDDAMIIGEWKVYRRGNGSRYSVFDRREDPGETKNLLESGGRAGRHAARLVRDFERIHAEHLDIAKGYGEAEWTILDADHSEELKALGYF